MKSMYSRLVETSDHRHSNVHSEIFHLPVVVLERSKRGVTIPILVETLTFIGLSALVSREGMRVPQSLVRRIKEA